METSQDQPHDRGEELCETVLHTYLEALRHPASELNERFSLPQRKEVRGAKGGPIQHKKSGVCSAEVDVYVGETTFNYVLSVHLERSRAYAALRDQKGLVEHFDLSDPNEPLKEENIQALYEALAVDIASHFGTDS